MRYKSFLCTVAGYLLFFAIEARTLEQEMIRNVRGDPKVVDNENNSVEAAARIHNAITIFLCGDVMTGRGIDQILAHPSDPTIYESYMKSARGYVKIAEEANGPIDYPVSYSYVWGDALKELDRVVPDVRIINLETSVTKSNDYWKGKGINYRMHPENIPILTAAKIDVCSLANNHVLDWGYSGLRETLDSLNGANMKIVGAGINLFEAQMPAVKKVPKKGRVVVFAFGSGTSGVPYSWRALDKKPGINRLRDLSDKSLFDIQKKVRQIKRMGDIVVVSMHWGANWGYSIPRDQMVFAHRLIDEVGVDIIHGHSSHHAKAIEVYKDKLILYGCGDFINDYEGIGGYEEFRADLSLMYFATVDPSTGKLLELQMTPTQIRRFKVIRASNVDTLWLKDTINREGTAFGTKVKVTEDNRLTLKWN
jgi:poly-gamma-glutamate capsule biosynthesis protein CapA/YwtB (metallophosphatase superfamily)